MMKRLVNSIRITSERLRWSHGEGWTEGTVEARSDADKEQLVEGGEVGHNEETIKLNENESMNLGRKHRMNLPANAIGNATQNKS